MSIRMNVIRLCDKIKGMIRERISDIQPPPIIEGRVKSIYSIYKKVYVKGKDFSEIYDIYAVRIILQTVVECYNVLGIIHDMFRPIPYRFKDYIAMPNPTATSRSIRPLSAGKAYHLKYR